jgi:sugar phosphate isomerase/epimerase
MQLGLSSYTYGWAVGVRGYPLASPLDEHGLLDKCLEHRVKVLQLGDNLPVHAFTAERLQRLAERVARENVRLELGARGLTLQHVQRYAGLARQLGAKLLRFVIDDTHYHPTPAVVTEILRASHAQLDGLLLGIENHDRFPAATLRSVLEGAGSERIGVCLDTANSLGAGEGLDAVVSVLGSLTVNLHVKDFAIQRLTHQMGFTVHGRPAGSGMLDLAALLRQLAPHGRCATAILELWTPPERELADTVAKEARWTAESMDYLRQFFPPITA